MTGALSGLKIIDLTRVLGGPYATMILADHGADVIKVEPPQGDETRDWGPPFLERGEGERDASYFLGVNRNKRGISLDLSRAEGREVMWRLLDGADILVENFKPGTMDRWGLGYNALVERFPRLIHCRISGFGADGPLGGMPGYDAILQAMTGLMSINGRADSEPLRMGPPVVDLATGLYSVIGILMALHERERSGRGQFVDMTLHDCGMALLHPQAANYFLSGKRPPRAGNTHPNIAPYDCFPTRTCLIYIAIGNDGQFRRFCDLIGRPELGCDPLYATNADRIANRASLTAAITAAIAGADGVALAGTLLRAGLPAGPVLAVDEAMAAPHTAAREMVIETEGLRMLASPVKLSRSKARKPVPPPRFAERTAEVLSEHGFSAGDIASLSKAGVTPTTRRK